MWGQRPGQPDASPLDRGRDVEGDGGREGTHGARAEGPGDPRGAAGSAGHRAQARAPRTHRAGSHARRGRRHCREEPAPGRPAPGGGLRVDAAQDLSRPCRRQGRGLGPGRGRRAARAPDPRSSHEAAGSADRGSGSRKIRADGPGRGQGSGRRGSRVSDEQGGSETLRVLVCDDHALFRRGLQMVLEQEPDLELVGEAADGEEVVQRAQELMPDVILMDVRMPRKSGIEAASEIKDALPHVKILMLTISDDEADLYEAIKAGASGYLLKEIPIEEVADAIRSVWAGQSRISPSMASKLLTEFAAMTKATEEKPQMPSPRLTDREMEVLRLVAQGLNNRDIAGKLFISENTVKNHIRNILEKLHLHSRMEAVVYAVREKMIEIN